MRLIQRIGMKLCVTINQLVNSFSFVFFFCPFLTTRRQLSFRKNAFYLLKVLFSVLYVASTPESDLILETTFELRSCKGNQSVISHMTSAGLPGFSGASHSLYAMLSLQDLIGSQYSSHFP